MNEKLSFVCLLMKRKEKYFYRTIYSNDLNINARVTTGFRN